MYKRLRNLLLDVHQKPMTSQKDLLHTAFTHWQKEEEQVDDVLLMGVRI